MLILLVLACSGEPVPTAAPPVAAPAPAERAPLPSAPSLDAFGLIIGKSTPADLDAWLASRQLTCPGAPSPRTTTHRYTCQGALPPMPERPTDGRLSQILLVRGDDTPLTHVSLMRSHSLPSAAAKDYDASVAAIAAVHGAPHEGEASADPAKVDARLVHYDAAWHYGDLEITVGLNRFGGPEWTVSESWDVPGAEKTHKPRPPPNPHRTP